MSKKLDRAEALEARLLEETGTRNRAVDILGEYRLWLDTNGIPADADGWPSEEAYAEGNIRAFMAARATAEAVEENQR